MKDDLSKLFIHYGSSEYDEDRFCEICNEYIPHNKPELDTGLWASPLDSDYSWKDLTTEDELMRLDFDKDNYFVFKLKDNARIIKITSLDDLSKLSKYKIDNPYLNKTDNISIDFEKMKEDYDAIIVYLYRDTSKKCRPGNNLHISFCGWDCDSILVLNKEVVEPIDWKENEDESI